MDTLNKEIGKKIIDLRKSKGYTRDDLAKKIGMSPNTLRNYENGLREPGHQFIKEIANHFGVTSDFLLGLEKNNPPADNSEGIIEEIIAEPIKDYRDRLKILTRAFVECGFMEEGGDISDDDLLMFKSVLTILDVHFSNRNGGTS